MRAVPALGALFLALLLAGCGQTSQPAAVPTRAALAAVLPPPTPAVIDTTLVPTHTPAPFPTAPPTLSPTAPPTPSPPSTEPACSGPGRVITDTFTSQYAGEEVAYRVYLPPCYEALGQRLPVLYLLHGNIHDESFWDGVGADEALEAAIGSGALSPFLLVMPNGGAIANNTSGGPYSFESVVLEELIPAVESSYCVWGEPAGRAIGGISRGGYWALEIAFRHPDQFASVGGHSAALLDIGATVDLNPQFTGVNNDLGALRVYFDIGEEDWVRPNIERLHADMSAAGVPHEWVLNPGGHDDAYWSAHVGEYLTWYGAPWTTGNDYPPCP